MATKKKTTAKRKPEKRPSRIKKAPPQSRIDHGETPPDTEAPLSAALFGQQLPFDEPGPFIPWAQEPNIGLWKDGSQLLYEARQSEHTQFMHTEGCPSGWVKTGSQLIEERVEAADLPGPVAGGYLIRVIRLTFWICPDSNRTRTTRELVSAHSGEELEREAPRRIAQGDRSLPLPPRRPLPPGRRPVNPIFFKGPGISFYPPPDGIVCGDAFQGALTEILMRYHLPLDLEGEPETLPNDVVDTMAASILPGSLASTARLPQMFGGMSAPQRIWTFRTVFPCPAPCRPLEPLVRDPSGDEEIVTTATGPGGVVVTFTQSHRVWLFDCG